MVNSWKRFGDGWVMADAQGRAEGITVTITVAEIHWLSLGWMGCSNIRFSGGRVSRCNFLDHTHSVRLSTWLMSHNNFEWDMNGHYCTQRWDQQFQRLFCKGLSGGTGRPEGSLVTITDAKHHWSAFHTKRWPNFPAFWMVVVKWKQWPLLFLASPTCKRRRDKTVTTV